MRRTAIVVRGMLVAGVVALPGGIAAASSDDTGAGDTAVDSEAPSETTPDAGTEASAPDGTTDDSDDSGGASAGEIDIEFQIDMMLGLVPEDEIQAYYTDQNEANERKIQECMRDAGFEYVIDTQMMVFEDPRSNMDPVEYAQQYGFGVWTQMDPDRNPYQSMNDQVWANQEVLDALNPSEQNAWYEANSRCSQEAYSSGDDIWRNPMVQQALEDFEETVINDPRMRDAEEAWRTCMADAGQPFESQQEMNDHVYAVWNGDDELAELEMQFWESEAWTEDSPDHAQWLTLVDEEIAIAVADATCSPALQEVREEVQKDLRPELVAVWQTIDWDLPPVTYPGEGEEWIFTDGSLVPEAELSTPDDSTADDSTGDDSTGDEGPAPLDLSGGGSDTTEP